MPDAPSEQIQSEGALAKDAPRHKSFHGLHDFIFALSLAHLCFIQSWFGLTFNGDYGYYHKLPVTTDDLLAFCFNLFVFTLIFFGAVICVRLTQGRILRLTADLSLWLVLLVPMSFVRVHYLGLGLIALLKNPGALFLGLTVAAAIVRWHRAATRIATAIVLILSPLVLVTFGKIGLFILHPGSVAVPSPAPLLAVPSSHSHPRLLWIVFDELDQRLAFPERPRGLTLPAFDRLCRESLVATNAYPPAAFTRLSLPALITGRLVSASTPISDRDMMLTFADTKKSGQWSSEPNVFSRARNLGLNTALTGWYHPYTRILGPVLNDSCWYPIPLYEQARAETFWGGVCNQIWAMASPVHQRRLYIRLYQQSLADSIRFATNSYFGLVFLHLPVPHLPGIYRPERDRFTITGFSTIGGYFDNLVLADRTLAQLRRAMEQAGTWNSTWVVTSSDHWWRGAKEYDGRTDYRVPFILKAPGGSGGATYASGFNTVVSRDLILAILRGEVSSLEDAAGWLDANRAPPPRNYDALGGMP